MQQFAAGSNTYIFKEVIYPTSVNADDGGAAPNRNRLATFSTRAPEDQTNICYKSRVENTHLEEQQEQPPQTTSVLAVPNCFWKCETESGL